MAFLVERCGEMVGFRKIVADRWEFANEFFRKGAKHLLAEIHRRKSAQPLPTPLPPHQPYHHHLHHHHLNPFSPPPPPPTQPVYHFQEEHAATAHGVHGGNNSSDGSGGGDFLAALSEDNRQLRRRNSLLLSELAHMKKLYNDIIYFLQNHVAPVTSPSSAAHASQQLPSAGAASSCRLMELDPSSPSPPPRPEAADADDDGTVKLFGVALQGKKKKRAHREDGDEDHEQGSSEV
ncbi:heat stress transcription factor B-4b-like [Panicum miliaceum]|uniref:Heat stress transcription factor B-4b-like n=1 Tax=Panicum miliaceum TaxID=4540 RepID=A0A3L6TBY9_PANMI|nr:heat stress transcription factor B-4b-like [Panicum miliaceum]